MNFFFKEIEQGMGRAKGTETQRASVCLWVATSLRVHVCVGAM